MIAEIYSKPNCPYCTKAKALLKLKNITYQEFVVNTGTPINYPQLSENQHFVTKDQLLERIPTARTLPQIWLNDEYIGGYTELAAHFGVK